MFIAFSTNNAQVPLSLSFDTRRANNISQTLDTEGQHGGNNNCLHEQVQLPFDTHTHKTCLRFSVQTKNTPLTNRNQQTSTNQPNQPSNHQTTTSYKTSQTTYTPLMLRTLDAPGDLQKPSSKVEKGLADTLQVLQSGPFHSLSEGLGLHH